ncbi:penicillin-binding protein [bacterium (Candidatus Blackallbacteria) CG17_big_fil_post_rev_8_21_14_2_50_48_46]|uniref:Penicillin-binding protein n=1 Tax=bacterium (Candidatus Blackallbacteria) CG17_big_fil_post_rev_8_21_14_2_50_48_46 TaxID=2014261 RepID=A0A2M7G4L5_9BACT|nr:MAG: penicillin-binding protein [bacterium (Candidatus Blackallbacteria) CG18_big_fil_WC_8_21_14_2_50_49_26]PIW16858.1 MAG: penicillin-binding protein [bacterium (Candidatus Blackallbacteria) CG17_big_fil_post_rev_8_21_14_2_50_48_46]PIW48055.1 MAG: penicillin-binding protein [bacterium (Candidatus Blackallbacteria) CG13_big_fil_rev_8_21_14_2_50_49_14]
MARQGALGAALIFAAFSPVFIPDFAARAAQKSSLEQLSKAPKFHGTVLMVKEGKVVFQAAQGYCDIRSQKKLEMNSAFNLASVSKQFTALAIAQLVEAGKLRYEDKIQKYLKLPYPEITVDHLLGHRSGLPDYIELAEEEWDTDQLLTNADILNLFRKHKPALAFKPNSKYDYSNTGYAFLASLVEAVSKQSFADYLKAHVFTPAGMQDSFVYQPGKSKPLVKGMAYQRNQLVGDDLTWMDGVVGDGGIYSSALDLRKWQEALFQGKLISKAGLKMLFQPGQLNNGKTTDYGYGWVIDEEGDLVWHNGSWAGFRTLISYQISEDFLTIVLNNSGYEDNDGLVEKISKDLQ